MSKKFYFLGTQLENMRDMQSKGRGVQVQGERHFNVKLTDEQVASIRADKRDEGQLSRQYGVSWTHIKRIRSGVTRRAAQ